MATLGPKRRNEEVDLGRLMMRPLYFGMGTNVFLPMGVLLICFFAAQAGDGGGNIGGFIDSRPPANPIWYLFGAAAVIQAIAAIVMRNRALREPMTVRKETFVRDLMAGVNRAYRRSFMINALTTLWIGAYYLISGDLRFTMVLALIVFVAFQILRPRWRGIENVVDRQEELVESGKFASGRLGLSE